VNIAMGILQFLQPYKAYKIKVKLLSCPFKNSFLASESLENIKISILM
jgi:hypothetical protein